MSLLKEVNEAIDTYVVAKILSDENRRPVECWQGRDKISIRRNRSGNYLEFNIYDDEIHVELYHIITMLTKEKLFTTFPNYTVDDRPEVQTITISMGGQPIQQKRQYDRKVFRFVLKSAEEVKEFLSIVDLYI